jgi:DNA-damage-inducible protein J
MSTNSIIRARIDEDIKERATAVLSTMGLTVSDAVRILLTRVARDEAFPFDLIPNALTAETLRKSELGEDVHYAKDAKELFKDLGI